MLAFCRLALLSAIKKRGNIKYFIPVCLLFTFLPFTAQANTGDQDLAELDFEDLMEIEVTSVSKTIEKLSEAAAAAYVVTADDIRRSGATSIPEALRLVPGVDAVQIDPNKWAISIRGFNGRFANKLLVLIDGRSVYTPTHSGVYWEYLDYLMADIARIEVIRGPGATLWGANAVNGVINIITREAGENPGGALYLAAGNEYQGIGARQGGELSDNAQLRVYAKGKRLGESVDSTGAGQNNDGDYLQTGFRLDTQQSADQWIILQGDLYREALGEQHTVPNLYTNGTTDLTAEINDEVAAKGGNLSARWGRLTGLGSELTARLSYDFYANDDFKYSEDRQTVNFELQHRFNPFTAHSLVWGGGYRGSKNKMDYSELVSGGNETAYGSIWNLFIQDTVSFPEYQINLTLGTKLEGYSYTDTQLQPNIRVSWLANEQFTWWASIARAMRTPSQWEQEFTLNYDMYETSIGTTLIKFIGSEDYKSEQLDAYEMGIRWQIKRELTVDLAFFYNRYKNIRSYDLSSLTIGSPYSVIELEINNNIEGQSRGLELLTTWQAGPRSRFRFVYSFLDTDLVDTEEVEYFSDSLISMMTERSPAHQASIWGSFDLSDSVELDSRFYYTSQRRWDDDIIDATLDADLRIAWQATKSLGLSLVGSNLLHAESQQFLAESWPSASYIERSIFLKAVVTW